MSIIPNNMNMTNMATSKMAEQDLNNKRRDIDALRRSFAPEIDQDKKLREACKGFETIFIKQMWEEMQSTINESDFLKGKDEKYWRSMYNQELAETLSDAGGVGIADMMYKQLSGQLASASRTTASTSLDANSNSFEVKSVPLMGSAVAEAKQLQGRYNKSEIDNKLGTDNKNMPATQVNNVQKTQEDSIYSAHIIQADPPNLEEIKKKSIENANNAIASLNAKQGSSLSSNSKVIQDVIEQLKTQRDRRNYSDNAQTLNNTQQVAALNIQNRTAQLERVSAYTQPLLNKVGNNAILPNVNEYKQNITKRVASANPTPLAGNVHGSPGITPSKYVQDNSFIKPNPAANNTANVNAQTSQALSMTGEQARTFANSQIIQPQQAMAKQDPNILPVGK